MKSLIACTCYITNDPSDRFCYQTAGIQFWLDFVKHINPGASIAIFDNLSPCLLSKELKGIDQKITLRGDPTDLFPLYPGVTLYQYPDNPCIRNFEKSESEFKPGQPFNASLYRMIAHCLTHPDLDEFMHLESDCYTTLPLEVASRYWEPSKEMMAPRLRCLFDGRTPESAFCYFNKKGMEKCGKNLLLRYKVQEGLEPFLLEHFGYEYWQELQIEGDRIEERQDWFEGTYTRYLRPDLYSFIHHATRRQINRWLEDRASDFPYRIDGG